MNKKIAYTITLILIVIFCGKVDYQKGSEEIAYIIEADTIDYIIPFFNYENTSISYDTFNFTVNYIKDSVKVVRDSFNKAGDSAFVEISGYYHGTFSLEGKTRNFTGVAFQNIKVHREEDWVVDSISFVDRLSDTLIINILKLVINGDTIKNPYNLYSIYSPLILKEKINMDVEIDMDSIYGFVLIFTQKGIFRGSYQMDENKNHWWRFEDVELGKDDKINFFLIKAFHTRMFNGDYPFDVNEWSVPYIIK